jgi:mannose-6-phosphate isomerase-like protein (cupin superfamily)
MEIRKYDEHAPFTTKDGSIIRSLLDCANARVANQSLAEATLPTGCAPERRYHGKSEEFYYILEGTGVMEIDGQKQEVAAGDAILIPAKGLASDHCGSSVSVRRHTLMRTHSSPDKKRAGAGWPRLF